MTEAEKKLWYALRHRVALSGSHFRRQVPLDRFIADFCCIGAKLIVEVDGGQHFTPEGEANDATRTRVLNDQGYRVLRFSNNDVSREIDGVIATIVAAIQNTRAFLDPPTPTPQGGGESLTLNSISLDTRAQQ